MGKEDSGRRLTKDEKFAIQQMGRFWKDWLYLRDSESPDYFIAVNRFHPTQTKRVKKDQCVKQNTSKNTAKKKAPGKL